MVSTASCETSCFRSSLATANESESPAKPAGAKLARARRHGLAGLLAGLAAALLSACAGQSPPPQNALRAANVPPGAHDLTCEYAGLQGVQGWHDDNTDAASLFATFHFPEADTLPPKKKLTFGFQQMRSRTDEVGDEIASRPEVICNPEANAHNITHPGQ